MNAWKGDQVLEYGESVFQVLFLVYTFLGFNSITFGSGVIPPVMWLTFSLGGLLLGVRLWRWKRYRHMPGVRWLLVMCGACGVSIVLNREYGFKDNLIYFIFWLFYFFLLYTQPGGTRPELVEKRFRVAGHVLCVWGFILAAVSLAMLAAGYSEIVEIRGSTVIRGFTYGRLYGAYLTPNGGAVVGSVVILLSVYFLRVCRNMAYRVFAAGNILVQFFYLVLSDSRSGRLCLALGLGTYVLFAAVYSRRIRPGKRKPGIVAALVLAVVAGSLYAPAVAKKVYNDALSAASQQMAADTVAPEPDGSELSDPTPEETGQPYLPLDDYLVDRGYDLSGDISNRRFAIWKSGLEIFRHRPWFGTTFRGFRPFALEHLPDTYLVNNDYMQLETLDNDFMNLLVSNGLMGFGAFLLFVVGVLFYLLPRAFRRGNLDCRVPVMMGVCMAAAVYSMFSSGVLYLRSPVSVIFWLCLGSLVVLLSPKENENAV